MDTIYAQEKRGQRLHIVPLWGESAVNVALCGKRVSGWRMTSNVPARMCCKNCMRIERQNGTWRYLAIMREVLEYLERVMG